MSRPFNSFIFILSLVLALLFQFVPLRGETIFWRPMVVFLTVIFWVLAEPHVLGVGFAWLTGFVLDLLTGGLLGQNALVFAISIYLLILVGQRLNHFTVWHQVVVIAVLSLIYLLLNTVVSLVTGRDADDWHILYSLVSTVVIWPVWALFLWKFYKPEQT